jgi:(E)-4-hydroxy-3-methyl-but-2-enyl pyrophosphate reductase
LISSVYRIKIKSQTIKEASLNSTGHPVQSKPKKILIAEHSGFCYGVKMAVDKAFELADTSDRPVYVLGELIHNPQVIEKLKERQVKTVHTLDEIPPGTACLIRTHGVDPEHVDHAEAKGIAVSDATCPDVRRVQERAVSLAEEGYTVIVVGKEEHPEVIGIMAHSKRIPGAKIVAINSPKELEGALDGLSKSRIGVVSQTTQKEDNFFQVVAEAAKYARELKVFNTICPATYKRQTAAEKLAHEVDLMVVIGGKNSSNTTHLAEVCREAGTEAIHVETVEALTDHPALHDAETIGVTAGASTPDWLVEEVIHYLESLNSPNPQQ